MENTKIEKNEVSGLEKIEQTFHLRKEPWFLFGIFSILAILIFTVVVLLVISNNRIQIDDSQILASTIDIGSKSGGALQEVYVKIGDVVGANTVLARVGTELLKTNSEAEVIKINDTIGEIFNPGAAVVGVINPSDLRVVGKLEEDKGLKDVRIGQKAIFTVDAFGSKEFEGVVDEISPTAHNSDVVFSISDKRAENSFDIKVRFDVSKYPELKNGMSAKITIFKS